MLDQFLTKVFGPNYRTTISGAITTASVLAAGIALNPSSVAQVPEPYRTRLLAIAGTIYAISSLYKNAATADAKTVDKLTK